MSGKSRPSDVSICMIMSVFSRTNIEFLYPLKTYGDSADPTFFRDEFTALTLLKTINLSINNSTKFKWKNISRK